MISKLLFGGLICCAVVLILVGIWILGNVDGVNHEYIVEVVIIPLVVGLIVGLLVGLVGAFASSYPYGRFRYVEVIHNE
jgi:uncharacterized integral membrane protein